MEPKQEHNEIMKLIVGIVEGDSGGQEHEDIIQEIISDVVETILD